jgi:hypothetical protein
LLVFLFERGIEISRIDRRHLMCLAINADGRQVNKGAYTSPGKAGGYLQQFLILVHAIVTGRLRSVEAGQHEGCGEPDDFLRGARCHGSIPLQKRANAPSCIIPFEPEQTSVLPVHPWSAVGFIPMFEQSDMRAGSVLDAFAIENSVVNGGS